MKEVVRRELDVMLARSAQPVWFRIGLHLFYRWKTRSWTQSWGHWQYDGGDRSWPA